MSVPQGLLFSKPHALPCDLYPALLERAHRGLDLAGQRAVVVAVQS
jgi:hypothetical protein